MNLSLKEKDTEVYFLSLREMMRQKQGLELIASENFASKATLSALSSHFNNKYAEGYPGSRHYGGCEVVDELERIAKKRALKAFNLEPKKWGVNVQPLSGTPANLEVYTALLHPGESLLGMKLDDGGHLSHGFQTKKRKVSASSLFWKSLQYTVDEKTCLIDYPKLLKIARQNKPKLIIAGASAYPRHIDYKLFREAADAAGAYLMADISHISGLVATKLSPDPFKYCDVVTTTTHKTLRGPRGALIFYRKKYEKMINQAVFPGLQGGPHMHQIAGIAVALGEAATEEFAQYQKQVLANMQVLCKELISNDVSLVTGGTDNHLALIDLRNKSVDGKRVEFVLNCMNISTNKNTIPGGSVGLRIGSPALTTRGLKEDDFRRVAQYIVKGIKIAQRLQSQTGPKLKPFKNAAIKDKEIASYKREVIDFASRFPLPGCDF